MDRPTLPESKRRGDVYRRLDEICEFAPVSGSNEDRVFWFCEWVRWLRGDAQQKLGLRLRYLRSQLAHHPQWQANVSACLTQLLASWDIKALLAYGGIARDYHFSGAVREWLAFRVLPVACSTTDASQVLGLAFEEHDDAWLNERDVGALACSLIDVDTRVRLTHELDAALIDLAGQITAQAESPNVRGLTNIERSPFRGLSDAASSLVATARSERSPDALLGRIRQCELGLQQHEQELVQRGADLNTTFQLARISHQLRRARLLTCWACDASETAAGHACVALIRAITRNTSGRRLFARSSGLLVRNLVDSAAAVGHDYLEAQGSWGAAFRAGLGGGALMAAAAVIKYWLASFQLPLFYEGVLFSINYAFVFCLAYLLHCTIATKLPAHTAAALAAAVHGDSGHRARIREFLRIWRVTVRMQLAGLIGNVLTAGPLAFAFDRVLFASSGRHFFSPETAHHALHANALLGPSPVYAALTGLMLWLSSLIGAAADNWTRVVHLNERLSTNLRVMRGAGAERARPLAARIVAKCGGLASNISLGFMLGAIPMLFEFVRIPLEIRHVTVSTASVALACASGMGSTSQQLWALAGVLCIGLVNVAASFALALRLALDANATRDSRSDARALIRIALLRWLTGGRTLRRRRRRPRGVGLRAEPSASTTTSPPPPA